MMAKLITALAAVTNFTLALDNVINHDIELSVLDCRKPKAIQYGSYPELCSQPTTSVDFSKDHQEKYTIVQHIDKQVLKGYRCTKYVSTMTNYCGAFSHLKLLRPPTFLVKEDVPIEVCKNTYKTGSYSPSELNRSFPLPINSQLNYQAVTQGTITVTPSNIQCKGIEAYVDGILHPEVLTMIDAKILIEEVDFEVNHETQEIVDLTNRDKMDPECYGKTSCFANNNTYVIIDKVNKCKLRTVRESKMIISVVTTVSGTKKLLVDIENDFALEVKETVPPRTECMKYITKMESTNMDQIFVVKNTYHKNSKLPVIDSDQVDLRIEQVASSTYLSFQQAQRDNVFGKRISEKLCATIANSLQNVERSPFHENGVLKLQGDLIVHTLCTPKVALTQLGAVWDDKCYDQYLPAQLDGDTVYISTILHLVTDKKFMQGLPNIPCEKSPTFITKRNGLIKATPEIVEVKYQLSDFSAKISEYMDLQDTNVDIFQYSGIYTEKEMLDFMDLVHYGRARQSIVTNMIETFCENQNCYFNQRAANNLDLIPRIELSVPEKIISWIRAKVFDVLATIGSYCSVIVLTVYMAQLMRLLKRQLVRIILCTGCFKKARSDDKVLDPEKADTRVHNDLEGSELEWLRISEGQTQRQRYANCRCKFCVNGEYKHAAYLKLPYGHCGCVRCKEHLVSLVPKYEWHLVDPDNIVFDHKEIDERFKLRDGEKERFVARAVCKCQICKGEKTHPDKRFKTKHCLCDKCDYHKLKEELEQDWGS